MKKKHMMQSRVGYTDVLASLFDSKSICPPQVQGTLFNAKHKPAKTARIVMFDVPEKGVEEGCEVLYVGKLVWDDEKEQGR